MSSPQCRELEAFQDASDGTRVACRSCPSLYLHSVVPSFPNAEDYLHWKNSSGCITRILKHLQDDHHRVWSETCRVEHVKHANTFGDDKVGSSDMPRVYSPNDFSMEGLQERMVRVFVAADLVRFLLLYLLH